MNDKPKATIAELEALLANDDHEVRINPDGSVTATPRPKPRVADILEFARKEPTHY